MWSPRGCISCAFLRLDLGADGATFEMTDVSEPKLQSRPGKDDRMSVVQETTGCQLFKEVSYLGWNLTAELPLHLYSLLCIHFHCGQL
ncbi:hypothetical protein SKAU_G00329940 [Synaphobranchus kaupii]|uniref:Uncharacterized protein n=1 Tax=Synaphobranchus kaupii TaxID=118154 RepID=A0A9Q1IKM0_SYNKA|nr:hypothetical protein SKAU_G00329940 [Synaphobranchus kaupii]